MKPRAALAPLTLVFVLVGAAPGLAQEDIDRAPPAFIDGVAYVGGDDDGVPEAGETLDVVIRLMAMQPLQEVGAELSSPTETVTVLQGGARYPAMGVKETGEATFRIRLSEDAARVAPCPDMPQPEPVDGDEPVASDGSPGSAPPGAAGDGGGSAPSDGGADGDAPETVVAEEAVGSDGNVSGGATADDDASRAAEEEKLAEQGASEDIPVAFQLTLKVAADGEAFELGTDSGIVCALSGIGIGPGGIEPALGAPESDGAMKDLLARQTGARDDGASSGSAAPVAWVLFAAVAAMLLRWRPELAQRRATR